ncbi:uncharacterized protein LOC143023695 [Oratosquilla oratoria]|uniref:uncharacterized protein LOC143023695 n=1 Tax=Oratosquilla oratoria TaxID=337810 RepID=UPI003F75A2FC
MRFLGVELFATSAGYVVWGKLPPWSQDRALNPPIETTALNSIRIDEPVLVDPPVHELWSLDSVGISLEKYSHLEEKAVKFFKSTVRKGNGAYTIRLPFKTEERPAINYGRAVAQLHSLKRNPHPSLYSDYRDILEEYLRLGFIETVPPGPEVDGKVHYLPHHPVYKNSSTTPVRIVFNASSRAYKNALSLNDALYTGPNLAQKIQSMILLFREGTYGVLVDISKAFLRIGVDEADRDYCRFLFFTSADMREIQAFRFKVVLFGATCSPYLLNQTIEHHLETYDHPLTTKLKSAFYVDNLQLTYDRIDEITVERPQIEQILNQANMPLDQWVSNANIEGFEHNGVRDYLGLRWDTERDMLGVAMPHQFKQAFEQPLLFKTKRKILSLFSSLYDPVGFLAPITLTGKLFIQSLWKTEEGWDTPLNGDSIRALPTILNNYRNLDTLQFPRNAHPGSHHALHVFCDASQRGFGVAAYTVSREGHVSFLTGRSRVAPKSMDKLSEELTIPRLELTAILFGSRLTKYLMNLRPSHYHTTFVWSDAKSALFWVRSQTSTSTYVLNRAREIKQLVQDHNLRLRHVSSKDNPADLASKGTNVAGLSNRQDLWFKGQEWLPHPERYPPQELDALPILIHANPTMVQETERAFNMTQFRDLPAAYNAFRILLRAVRAKASATPKSAFTREYTDISKDEPPSSLLMTEISSIKEDSN